MKPRKAQVRDKLRITGAIARKDIVDAVKNKTTAIIVAATFMLILSSKALPLLLDLRGALQVVVYDAGEAAFLTQPEEDDDVILYLVPSLVDLEDTISESRGKIIGIVLPADFDDKIDQNGKAEVEGYTAHWINAEDEAEMRTILEAKLTHSVGKPVSIHTQGNKIYPWPDSGGQPFMVALVLLVAVTLITVMVVPQLMIEEKETRTLDALFLSPATVNEVVAGKALAGLVFALLGAGVVLVFNAAMVQNWPLTLAALLSGALFAVAVGLLLGIVVDDQQSMNLVLGFVFIFLIFPAFLVNVMGPDWPEWVRIILPWIPTVALSNVLRISFSDTLEMGEIIGGLAIVLVSAAALYAIATWRMSKLEME
jgi:ABC-2 type transport system permease protein